jgi:hypothetical protein
MECDICNSTDCPVMHNCCDVCDDPECYRNCVEYADEEDYYYDKSGRSLPDWMFDNLEVS